MPQHQILICVATYDERANLPRLVEEIFAHVPACDLLVIDDNSPDGTGIWCDEHARSEPRLLCRHRAGKLGLGSAAKEGMRYAIDNGYTWLVNLDADFSHAPSAIPQLIKAVVSAPKVDVAVGSRYVAGGKIDGWPRRRQISSSLMNWVARVGLGLPVRDCSGSFRCYRVAMLPGLIQQIQSQGYSFYEEVLWRLTNADATFAEVPITFTERTVGHTKLGYRQAAAAAIQLVKLSVVWRTQQLINSLRRLSTPAAR